jgi:hypothetical protein
VCSPVLVIRNYLAGGWLTAHGIGQIAGLVSSCGSRPATAALISNSASRRLSWFQTRTFPPSVRSLVDAVNIGARATLNRKDGTYTGPGQQLMLSALEIAPAPTDAPMRCSEFRLAPLSVIESR